MKPFLTDALALASPSGRISKRALKAAQKRIHDQLFPAGYWEEINRRPQPSKAEKLLQAARQLRELAERGMNTTKYLKQALKFEAEAACIDAK